MSNKTSDKKNNACRNCSHHGLAFTAYSRASLCEAIYPATTGQARQVNSALLHAGQSKNDVHYRYIR